MTNFSFLKAKTEYALFAPACMEAEKNLCFCSCHVCSRLP